MDTRATHEDLLLQLKSAHAEFHRLIDSLPDEKFQQQSLNSGWTNGEIIAHMTFGFLVINVLLPMARLWGRLPPGSSKWFARLLNAMTGPFNWFNALGARGQGKVLTRSRIGPIFDRVYFSLLRKIDSIQEDEWERGMYYPTRWDANFEEFMTLRKLFEYPVKHFHFHLTQIARD